MYRRTLYPGLGLVLLAVLLLAFGCSDDKVPAPTGTSQQPGELTDPEFVPLQTQINTYLDETIELYNVGLDNINTLPLDSGEVENQHATLGPNDSLTVGYLNGWHVIYLARHNEFFDSFSKDSIQFRLDDVAIEDPTDCDYMHYVRSWSYDDNQTDYTHTNYDGFCDLVFTDLDQNACYINGENNVVYQWNYLSADSNVTAYFDMEVDVNNVQLNSVPNYGWVAACPASGTMTFDIDEAWSVNNGLATGMQVYSWQVSVSFEDGLATVSVTRDNTVWNYTYQVCNP